MSYSQKPAPQDKPEFYARWRNLEFGNRIRMWDSQEELRASGYTGTVTARSKVPGGACYYNVPAQEAVTQEQYGGMTFNESAPDEKLLWQGELMHHLGYGGYYLYGSEKKAPMRVALASSAREHTGLRALGLLKYHCKAKSYEMLMELLDTYPEAVIEFGIYSRCLGEIPGHNVVIWEVRNY